MTKPTGTDDIHNDHGDDDHGGRARAGAIVKPLRDGIDTALSHANDAAELAREKAARALDAARDGIGQARGTVGDVLSVGKDKAADAYATGRDKASEAYAAARERARLAGKTATGQFDANPIVALLGGIAVGVALGALLPRTERETKLLGGLGDRLRGLGDEVVHAARDAGQAKLADLGLTPDKARESLHTLIDGALAAATSAGSAAVHKAGVKPAGDAAR